MPVRYTSEFRNILGILYKIDIIDDDYSGSATDFVLNGEEGATIKYQKQGDRSYNLIKASSLGFEFAVENANDLQFITDLSTANEARFKVKLYRDNTFTGEDNPTGADYVFNWGGIVLADVSGFKDNPYPFGFKITATDGLGLLSSIKFTNLDGTAKTGRQSILKWIQHALKLTGTLDLWAADDCFIQTYIKWFEVNTMTAEVDDPADLMYLYYNSFNDIGEDGQLKPKTALQMLNVVCTLLQARLSLVDGYWRFQQVESMDQVKKFYYYKKDITTFTPPSGTGGIYPITNTTLDIYGELLGSEFTGFYQRRQSWQRPISDIKLTWEAGGENENGNIYPLFYSSFLQTPANQNNLEGQVLNAEQYSETFGPYFLPTENGWSQLGQSTPPQLGGFIDVSTGDYQLKVSVTIDFHLIKSSNNVGGANTYFNARFFRQYIKFRFKDEDNVQSNDRYIKINNGGYTNTDISPLVLGGDDLPYGSTGFGLSTQITADHTDRIKFSSDFMSLSSSDPVGTSYSSSVEANFQTQTIPLDCTLEILADDFADIKIVTAQGVEVGLDDNTIFGNFTLKMGVPKFVVQILKDGEIINNQTTSAYSVDTSNDLVQSGNYTQEMYFGDGPNGIGSKVIWIKTGSGYTQSTLWNLNAETEDKTIHRLAIESIVKFNRYHRTTINANCIEGTGSSGQPSELNNPARISRRSFYNRAGVFVYENYVFNGGTYNLGMAEMVGQWAKFEVASVSGVLINDNDVPEDDPESGGASFVLSPPNVSTEISNIDSITKLSAADGILIGDGATTSISVEALDGGLNDNFLLYIADKAGNKIQGIKLNGSAAKGATTLIVDSFIPRFNFSIGSYIVPSVKSAMLQAPENLALGVTDTAIYIKPQDFNTTDDNNMVMYSRKDMGSIQGSEYDRREIYCSSFIPAGFEVVAVDVYSNQNRDFDIKSSRIISNVTVLEESGGTSNTTLSVIPAWESVVDEYIIITFYPAAAADEIYGAKITIIKS